MKRHKIKPEGAEVFTDDPGGERPPAFPVRVGGKVLKCRGDGAMHNPVRDVTIEEYCGQPRLSSKPVESRASPAGLAREAQR